MPWGISHTQEAWHNVERRLALKKWIAPLRQCLMRTAGRARVGDALKFYIKRCRLMSHEELIEITLMRMIEHATCSNVGHYFFLDSDGTHQVSCDELTGCEERQSMSEALRRRFSN